MHDRRARNALLVSVLLTVGLYSLPYPYGFYASYPFLMLSTLAHELGHGVAGLLVGARFDRFVMFADGSGAALLHGNVGRFGRAFIAAGGLVGPAVVAGLSFVLARRAKAARITFVVFGGLLALALLLVVRSAFGFAFVALVAAACFLFGLRVRAQTSQVALVFVAVQLALSVFSRGDYLFTPVAETAVGPQPSDVANIAEALFLPYWFWGIACGLFSVVVLVAGLWTMLRRRR